MYVLLLRTGETVLLLTRDRQNRAITNAHAKVSPVTWLCMGCRLFQSVHATYLVVETCHLY